MSWGPAWTLFVRVGLTGCRRAVSGLPGTCGPYCSRVRLVRRLVDPLDQALRGSDHGKIWASVCPTAGRLGPRRSESIRAAGRVTWRVWPWVRSGSMHAQGSDVPGGVVTFGWRVVVHPGMGSPALLMLVVFRSKFPGRKFKSHPGVPPARLLVQTAAASRSKQ